MKVLVCSAQRLIGEALCSVLAGHEEVEATSACWGDETQIAQRLRESDPDIFVISGAFGDVRLRAIIEAVKKESPETAILVVAGGNSPDEFLWVLKIGVAGYITLECSVTQLLQAITKIERGEMVVSGVERKNSESRGHGTINEVQNGNAAALASLTPRENEILQMLSRGLSNRQIAETLYVSEHTVRTHIQNLRSKLNVRSKFQAAVLAMQAGISWGGVRDGMRF